MAARPSADPRTDVLDRLRTLVAVVGRDGTVRLSNRAFEAAGADVLAACLRAFGGLGPGSGPERVPLERAGTPYVASIATLEDGDVLVEGWEAAEDERSQERYRYCEARLAEAQAVAHVGSWEWDPRTGEVTWTAEMYRLHGLDPARADGIDVPSIRPFLRPEDVARWDDQIAHAARTGDPIEVEYEVLRADGTRRTLLGRGVAVHGPGGALVRIHGTSLDVTDMKHAQTELARRAAAVAAAEAEILSARQERLRAVEIHDGVVQRIAEAKLAFELGDSIAGFTGLERALAASRRVVAGLLGVTPDLRPGDLRIQERGSG